MIECCIALGSNLANPANQVQQALGHLSKLPSSALRAVSSLYQSAPMGPQDQNDYVNACALLATELDPAELLLAMQSIERQMGRVKTRHWGERVIDLDLIFYGRQTIELESPQLTVPHPHALERDFVVVPLLEIAADWKLPNGELLAHHAKQYQCYALKKLAL